MSIPIRTLAYGGLLALYWIIISPFFAGSERIISIFSTCIVLILLWLVQRKLGDSYQCIQRMVRSKRIDLIFGIGIGFVVTIRIIHEPLKQFISSNDASSSVVTQLMKEWLRNSDHQSMNQILQILPTERLWIVGGVVIVFLLHWILRSENTKKIQILTGLGIRKCTRELSWLINIFIKLKIYISCQLPLWKWIVDKWKSIDTPRPSRFLSDDPIKDSAEDLLNFQSQAYSFAELVRDNGSPKSMIFGLDAPWGSGKTTFINFCEEKWKKEDVIVFKFEPLQYVDRKKLLDNLLHGIATEIGKRYYVPELQTIVSKYAKFFDGMSMSIALGPASISLSRSEKDFDASTKEELNSCLARLGKKIVVVIDDLDRLEYSEIENILFGIKAALDLEYVSYILCYSTENLERMKSEELKESHASDNKIREFLEKFVQIKKTIIVDKDNLLSFVQASKYILQSKYISNHTLLERIIDGVQKLIADPTFFEKFLHDPRKIKRLLNVVIVQGLDRQNVDFRDFDFANKDLILLLLIFLDNPKIFRDIYISETMKDRGQFSLVTEFDPDDFPPELKSKTESRNLIYANSVRYNKYISKLNEHGQCLLNYIFDAETRLKDDEVLMNESDLGRSMTGKGEYSESARSIFACFNGAIGTGKNLVEYLQFIYSALLPGEERNDKDDSGDFPVSNDPQPLPPSKQSSSSTQIPANKKIESEITSASSPNAKEQHSFNINRVKDYLDDMRKLEDIFSEIGTLKHDYKGHEEFWRKLSHHPSDKFTKSHATEIIDYLVDHLPEYPMIDLSKNQSEFFSGLGTRHSLIFILIRILNNIGWHDAEGKHWDNTRSNILSIAHRIFGEGEWRGRGILDRLISPKRGILGLMDAMSFRLSCCHNRGGRNYNLFHALAYHADENATISGNVTDLAKNEVREISQYLFSRFKQQYIDPKKNIFEDIDNLDEEVACGSWYATFENLDADEKKKRASELKSILMAFLTYQLSNKETSSGIGCGLYDVSGKNDEGKINQKMNDYLFDICFDGSINEKNYEYFVQYLMINVELSTDDSPKYIPIISSFTKILDRDELRRFWREHAEVIKSKKFEEKDEAIWRSSTHEMKYKEIVKKIFDVLDEEFNQG